jgi:hypothetical protein
MPQNAAVAVVGGIKLYTETVGKEDVADIASVAGAPPATRR